MLYALIGFRGLGPKPTLTLLANSHKHPWAPFWDIIEYTGGTLGGTPMLFTNGVWAPQPPRPTARPDWLIAADDILCQRLRHCTRCGRPNPQVVWTGVEE